MDGLARDAHVDLVELRLRLGDGGVGGGDFMAARRNQAGFDLPLRLGEIGLVAVAREVGLVAGGDRGRALGQQSFLPVIFGLRQHQRRLGGCDGGLKHGDLLGALQRRLEVLQIGPAWRPSPCPRRAAGRAPAWPW